MHINLLTVPPIIFHEIINSLRYNQSVYFVLFVIKNIFLLNPKISHCLILFLKLYVFCCDLDILFYGESGL